MKKIIGLVFAVSSAILSLPASASAFQGYVAGIFVVSGKVVISVNNGGFSGAASPCSSATDNAYYLIDISTTFGKLQYSNALAAKTTGRLVYVVGDNGCNPNPYGPIGAEGLVGIDLKG